MEVLARSFAIVLRLQKALGVRGRAGFGRPTGIGRCAIFVARRAGRRGQGPLWRHTWRFRAEIGAMGEVGWGIGRDRAASHFLASVTERWSQEARCWAD